MNPSKPTAINGPNKVLNAPVHLGSMAANLENHVDDIKSIWVMQRDDNLVSYFYIYPDLSIYVSIINAMKSVIYIFK